MYRERDGNTQIHFKTKVGRTTHHEASLSRSCHATQRHVSASASEREYVYTRFIYMYMQIQCYLLLEQDSCSPFRGLNKEQSRIYSKWPKDRWEDMALHGVEIVLEASKNYFTQYKITNELHNIR